jgi:hypothetical protein
MPVTYLVNRNVIGNPILASNVAAGTSSNVMSIVADSVGNIYTGGAFSGTSCFLPNATATGPSTVISNNLSADAAGVGAYFAKYNSTGTMQYYWNLVQVTAAGQYVSSLALDSTGTYLYVALAYESNGSLAINTPSATGGSSTGFTLTTTTANAAWGLALLKITAATGAIVWGTCFDSGVTADSDYPTGLAVDSSGNVYLSFTYNTATSGSYSVYNAGATAPSATVGVTLYNNTNTALNGALVKFNSAGVAQWGASIVTSATTVVTSVIQTPTNIGIDPSGNIVIGVTVGANKTVTVYPGTTNATGTTVSIPVIGATNNYQLIIKYSANGPILWTAQVGQPSGTSSTNTITGISCGQYNSVYITGNINTASTGSVPATNIYNGNGAGQPPNTSASSITLPATSGPYGYVAKFNSTTGAVQWVSYASTLTSSSITSQYLFAYPNSSDTDLYIVGNYLNASGTTSIINYNGTTSSVALAQTSASNPSAFMQRMFLGNVIAAEVLQGTNASPTLMNTSFMDSSANNLYVSGQYLSSSGAAPLYVAGGTGSTTASGVSLPVTITTGTAGFWAKYS